MLGFAGPANAAKTATPLYWKTSYAAKPGGKARGILKAATHSGAAARFLVVRSRKVSGTRWLGLRLPTRPNRSIGWARATNFTVERARAKLVVSVKYRTLALFINGKRRWKAQVIVGKPSTPTPRGRFALYDRHRVNDDLRPWILETTAHSRKLREFEGGPARIALHGRHGKLMAPWGTAASNGCIRTPNWALRSIRKHVRLGSPIEIR